MARASETVEKVARDFDAMTARSRQRNRREEYRREAEALRSLAKDLRLYERLIEIRNRIEDRRRARV